MTKDKDKRMDCFTGVRNDGALRHCEGEARSNPVAFLLVCFATLAMTLLAGCSHDDVDEPGGDTATVSFSAGISWIASGSALAMTPETRTASGGNTWLTSDEVGIFMLTPGGTLPGDIARGADNLKYTPAAEGTTATLIPAEGTVPLYWPKTGTYDFAAYYPRLEVGTGGIDPATYTYPVNVSDQSGATELDILYARANGKTAGDNVAFTFAHTMAKVRINVVKGDDITDAGFAGIAASLHGMPTTARLSLADGTLTGEAGTAAINAPAVTPAEGYDATFEAIVIPQAAGATSGRYVRFGFTGNLPHYWNIPDTDALPAGKIITYNLRMGRLGVTFAGCTITPWDDSEPATTGDGDRVTIQSEANSYMARPGSAALLIPISQANRVLTADGLGATTTGLGGVATGNFTVELVWGDLPVGTGGVIEEIRPFGKYVFVKPGTTAGNAVVAIRDNTTGTIKWSWHVWVAEAVTYATDAQTGLTWMDRNLGAQANTPLVNGVFDNAQWINTHGLYYQWGRKDAFPRSDGTTGNQTHYRGNSTTATTTYIPQGEYTDLPGMVQNPFTFAVNRETYYGSLNTAGNTNKSWSGNSGEKTLYDPCPPGWKVPPLQVETKYSWGSNTESDNSEWTFKSYMTANRGAIFNGVNGTSALGHFYPASGYRVNITGNITSVNDNGSAWTTTPRTVYHSYYMAFNVNRTFTEGDAYENRSAGRTIRCVKE